MSGKSKQPEQTIDVVIVKTDWIEPATSELFPSFKARGFYQGCKFTFHPDDYLSKHSQRIPRNAIVYTHAGICAELKPLYGLMNLVDPKSLDYRDDLKFVIDLGVVAISKDGGMIGVDGNTEETQKFILTLTDNKGKVIIRTRNPGVVGDDQSQKNIVLNGE